MHIHHLLLLQTFLWKLSEHSWRKCFFHFRTVGYIFHLPSPVLWLLKLVFHSLHTFPRAVVDFHFKQFFSKRKRVSVLVLVCYFSDETATVQPQVHRSRKDDDDENEDLNESNYDEVRGNHKAMVFLILFLQVKIV